MPIRADFHKNHCSNLEQSRFTLEHEFSKNPNPTDTYFPLKYLFVLLISGMTWIGYGCQNSGELVLASKGKAKVDIVVMEKADEPITRAAKELQLYLQKMSGATPEILVQKTENPVIILGEADALENTEIYYGIENGNLVISGGSPQATLYAVYTFLEREMGCRFFSPKVEDIPQQARLTVPANLSYQYSPPIHVRTVHSRLFYDHPDFADKLRVTHEAFPFYVPKARVHTFHRFLPADQFYENHPEYYALRNGRRLTTQLCLTNPEVLEIVRDSVEELLAQYPESNVVSVSQDDNTQYCQCQSCEEIHQREGSPAGSMIYFVNQIAEEFPEKMISTLAYQYTRKAPLHIKPAPNVLITLCSIECDRSAAIAEKCQDFARDLEEWGKLTDNVRIWDYTTQFTNFLAPFPNIYTLKPNLELFEVNHAKWVFEQHSNHPSELFELRSYLTAKLLWNPQADADQIIDEFLEGYYEEAAPFVKSYITTIHEKIKQDSSFFLFLYGDPAQGFETFLSKDMLATYDNLFDQGAEAVKGKPEIAARVSEARLSVDYAILEYAKREMKTAKADPFFDLPGRLKRFRKTLQQADITMMNEMRYQVDEYLKLYENTVARSGNNNLAYQKNVQLLTKPKKYAGENPQALTDGAYGGNNFYANWLGFEGNDLEAVIDLGSSQSITEISTAFLQVTNHIVFFPEKVSFYSSSDGQSYSFLGELINQTPLNKDSKINDIQYFDFNFPEKEIRFIKIIGQNRKVAPDWHHAAGLPAWIFIDEIEVR